MIKEFFADGAVMDVPMGGSPAIADALARGITRRGGAVLTRAHVDELLFEGGACVGAKLADGSTRRAKTAVVSNAPVWQTARLVPEGLLPPDVRGTNLDAANTPKTGSFLHLHVGFDADGLDDLAVHHIVVRDWDAPIDAKDNCVFVAIHSTLDKGAAPEGHHVLHAYLPATEPYADWANMDRKSRAYKDLKERRAEVLWEAVETFIPDIRKRAVVASVGTPLTHARYLRREAGTFGPAFAAGERAFPGHKSPLAGLFCCGDSTFPGIGVPAVAGSGIAVAHAIAPTRKHLALLDEMRAKGTLD